VTTTALDLANGAGLVLTGVTGGVIITVEPPTDRASAEAVMHRGVARVADAAADAGIQLVLVSQIYVTRAREHPELAAIIEARAHDEQAVRDSGGPYTIIRPSWLTDGRAGGVGLEQGDTGDGSVSRDAVAQATVAALLRAEALGKTFEIYDEPSAGKPDWAALFGGLISDGKGAGI
jgi:uncharacterized protein YbjT (DUF2867 family)